MHSSLIKILIPNFLSDSLTSHPLGTTVRATNLLHQMPVRRQILLSKASKTIDEIKAMLRSYAFARPQIRWSLKILGGRDVRSDWIYVPPKDGTIMDVTKALVGKKVAEECILCEWSTSTGNERPMIQREDFRIRGLFPKSRCGKKTDYRISRANVLKILRN